MPLKNTIWLLVLLLVFHQSIDCNSVPTNVKLSKTHLQQNSAVNSLISDTQQTNAEGNVCHGDFEIKNDSNNLHVIANCTRIEGYVRILLIEKDSKEKLNNISLPLLVEITDYLLIYSVTHVTTLDWFPNLQNISGESLFEGNALIISNLDDLTHIGFRKLTHIRGGVRFQNVENLCFDQIDYKFVAQAIKSQSLKTEESQQLLPGFMFKLQGFWSPVPNDVTVEWNHISSIKNKSIDFFILELIEFEDLDTYSKTFEKYNCPSIKTTVRQDSDYYSKCGKSIRNDSLPLINYQRELNNKLKNKMNTKDDSPKPYFVFSTIQQVLSLNLMLDKIMAISYKSRDNYGQDVSQNQTRIETVPIKSFDSKIHRIYRVFRYISHDNHTKYNFSGIRNYQDYYIILSACRSLSGELSCSVAAHHQLKTLPSESGDDIDENSVNLTVNQTNVTISWTEPAKPNGAIISYEIYLQESDNKTNKKTFCITRPQFRAKYRSYTINENDYYLTENTEFKIRAISMYGPSKRWTRYFAFNQIDYSTSEQKKQPSIIIMTVGLTGLLVIFLLTAIIFYLSRRKKKLERVSINPEYESLIEWEKKRSDVTMSHVLGEGAFGRVFYGELQNNNKLIKCAVKTMHSDSRTSERESFLKEANIMKFLSFIDCHHIVKLIGIVSDSNPVRVLMEYMANGDLRTYLRSNRPDNYENPNRRVPTWNRIFQMAIEIADGMAYLSANKFVHRDLAARNCMVSEDLTVKIGDFGMTRDIYHKDYYRKLDSKMIPVRWMSPEALKDNVYTTYSDIWSYGVLLWEMVTMGAQPYQEYSNESVFQNVIRGLRLTEPKNCPKKLWRIMQFCWRKNPKSRPSFGEIIEYLLPSANQSFREVCYYLNRKPIVKKQQSLKNMSYSLIPTNRLLLNDVKQSNDSDNGQYLQMKPQIQ